MKLQYYLGKRVNCFLAIIIAMLLLFSLIGCSGGRDQIESDQPTDGMKTDQLEDENNRLREELERANKNIRDLERRLGELEDAINAVPTEDVPDQIDLVPPEVAPNNLLIGEWFYQDFHEEEIIVGYKVLYLTRMALVK